MSTCSAAPIVENAVAKPQRSRSVLTTCGQVKMRAVTAPAQAVGGLQSSERLRLRNNTVRSMMPMTVGPEPEVGNDAMVTDSMARPTSSSTAPRRLDPSRSRDDVVGMSADRPDDGRPTSVRPHPSVKHRQASFTTTSACNDGQQTPAMLQRHHETSIDTIPAADVAVSDGTSPGDEAAGCRLLGDDGTSRQPYHQQQQQETAQNSATAAAEMASVDDANSGCSQSEDELDDCVRRSRSSSSVITSDDNGDNKVVRCVAAIDGRHLDTASMMSDDVEQSVIVVVVDAGGVNVEHLPTPTESSDHAMTGVVVNDRRSNAAVSAADDRTCGGSSDTICRDAEVIMDGLQSDQTLPRVLSGETGSDVACVVRRRTPIATDDTKKKITTTKKKNVFKLKRSVTEAGAKLAHFDAEEAEGHRAKDDGDLSDDDEGVYDETFRYSTYKFVGDVNRPSPNVGIFSALCEKVVVDDIASCSISSKSVDSAVTSSSIQTHVAGERQRSLSLQMYATTLFEKTVHRQCTLMTYVSMSETKYVVERILTLNRRDPEDSYGFHISRVNPVIVSTVEPGSVADQTGVQVGDRLVTVNNINVVAESRDAVCKLISTDPCQVQLGVAAGVLSRDYPLHSGYLDRYEGRIGLLRTWRHRWVQIKHDGFLYIYRNDSDADPLGAFGLQNCVVCRETQFSGRVYVFKLVKYGKKLETHYFQCQTANDVTVWASIIHSMSSRKTTNLSADSWLDISSHNVSVAALSIREPDCHGFLTKIGYHCKTWRRRYCVLKNACLYYYRDAASTTAKGVAHLHGYLVQEDSQTRRFGFQLIPPVFSMRHFRFTAENETEKKRWMTAMSLSIGRWIAVSQS